MDTNSHLRVQRYITYIQLQLCARARGKENRWIVMSCLEVFKGLYVSLSLSLSVFLPDTEKTRAKWKKASSRRANCLFSDSVALHFFWQKQSNMILYDVIALQPQFPNQHLTHPTAVVNIMGKIRFLTQSKTHTMSPWKESYTRLKSKWRIQTN